MEAAVDWIAQILEHLRVFSHIGLETKCSVDIVEIFDDAVYLHNICNRLKVVNECHGLCVTADSLLRSIFFNLIDDSIKQWENGQSNPIIF